MFKRIFRNFIKLVGVLGIGLSVFLGILFWHLNAGPVSLSFLTPYFEETFKLDDNSFEIKLKDTILTWVEEEQNFRIKLEGIRAIASGGKVIAQIPELVISLSGEAFLKGKLAPRSLGIFGPSLNIVRMESGKLKLGLTNYPKINDPEQVTNQDLIDGIISQLFSPIAVGQPLSYLRRIDVFSADVTIHDREFDVKWRAPETDLVLIRNGEIVNLFADLVLKSNDLLVSETATINLRGDYLVNKNMAQITVGFSDLNPVIFAPLSSKFKTLENFNLPLSGDINLVIQKDGEINKFKFNLSSGRGKISFQEPIQVSAMVKEINFLGQYDKRVGRLKIENLTLDLDKDDALKLPAPFDHEWPGGRVSLKANYDFDFERLTVQEINFFTKEGKVAASATIHKSMDRVAFELDGEASDLAIKQILAAWPKGVSGIARDWLIENIVAGTVPSMKANMAGSYSRKNGFEVSTILGFIDFQDMTVDYFSSMPKLTAAEGKVKFDRDQIDIEIKRGKSNGLSIENGQVLLTGLDKIDQHVAVRFEIKGPIGSAVKFANSSSMKHLESIGYAPNLIKGKFSSKIKLDFIPEKGLTLDKIRMSTKGILQNIEVPKIALDLNLTMGELKFKADNDSMTIMGNGQLSGVKTELEWHENFTNKELYSRKYRLKAIVDEENWREKLKLTFPPFNKTYTNGVIGADVTIKVSNDGSGELKANLDLKDTLITLPRLGWYKPEKIAADAVITATFLNNRFESIPKVVYTGGGLNLTANASFKSDGVLKQVNINHFKFGQTDVQAIIAPHSDPENEGWNIHVSGKQLDLIEWMASEDMVSEKTKGVPLIFSLNLDAIQLYPNKNLLDVNGVISFDGWVWKEAEIRSGRGINKALDIKLEAKIGKRFLNVEAKDAGLILKVFDYYDNLIGGKLSLRGEYDGMSPESKFSGHVRIDDFRVIKAPILANLLNVASITGIVDELSGVGIGFRRLVVPFESKDDVITVKDASVSGLSLGMTASGNIDTSRGTIDFKGTIVPAYMLNTALTRIPIIGKLFSGGEKFGGVFAANYIMTGNIKEPEISTNPLSVLAPGFLRELFRIFDEPTKKLVKN